MKLKLKIDRVIIASFGIILLYMAPYFIMGEDSYVKIHDNLDVKIPLFKILGESDQIFSGNDVIVPNFPGEMPRGVLGSEFNVMLGLYHYFKPYNAYIINNLLIRIIGFLGMYLLLEHHFTPKADKKILAFAALSFALLPYWTSGGLTVAGQPLALYSFLNIRERKIDVWNWLILVCIPFYSSFILAFLFFLTAITLLFIYDAVTKKKINYYLLFAVCLMTITYLVIEYRLILSMFFDSGWVSHRNERFSAGISAGAILKKTFHLLLFNQYHAHSVHTPAIVIALALAATKFLRSWKSSMPFLIVCGSALAIVIFYGLNALILRPLLTECYPSVRLFNYTRFYFLIPLLWGVIFGLSIDLIWREIAHGKLLVYGIVTLQFAILIYLSEYNVEKRERGISYREYYAESLLGEVKDYIASPVESYRVGTIGFEPAVTLYNGFYTVDMYSSNYPLAYKHRFRPVITKELDKNLGLKRYFDNWGSRVYLFSADLFGIPLLQMDEELVVKNLSINTTELKKLGCKYVFSSVKIMNATEIDLNLLKVFHQSDLPWFLHLYEIK